MSARPSDTEVRKIYEKSIRLLDSSQAQLRHVRQILKKTVNRLSAIYQDDDDQVRKILDAVNESVNHKMDLHQLEALIDELFVQINQDSLDGIGNGESFANQLGRAVDASAGCDFVKQYKSKLREIVSSQLSDSQVAKKVIELFSEIAKDLEEHKSLSDYRLDSVRTFAAKISATEVCSYEDSDDIDDILGSLAHDLIPFIQAGFEQGSKQQKPKDRSAEMTVTDILSEFMNQLSLHDDVKNQRKSLLRELSYEVDDVGAWKNIIANMVDVVNGSIDKLQAEKQEMQVFITKVIEQLNGIESYVQQTRAQTAKSAQQTIAFSGAMSTDMSDIQTTVVEAEDLGALKRDVQDQIANIKKNVERNIKAVEETEKQSMENYSYMMSELTKTQHESENLREQLKESHSQLLRDHLTGLPNRMAFNERVESEFHRWNRHQSPLCIAVWDIDHFKRFNDNYGHDVGDRVLKIVANLIHNRIRKVDMFARYGGEEFVMLMPDTELENALKLCNTLRVKLSEADFHYDSEEVSITSSVGIAAFNEGDTVEEVMKRADTALYQSKDNGRNCCTADGIKE